MSAVNNYSASLGMSFGYEESLDRRCRRCLDEGIDAQGRWCHCSYGWQARDEAAEEALARLAEQAAVDGGVWGDAS